MAHLLSTCRRCTHHDEDGRHQPTRISLSFYIANSKLVHKPNSSSSNPTFSLPVPYYIYKQPTWYPSAQNGHTANKAKPVRHSASLHPPSVTNSKQTSFLTSFSPSPTSPSHFRKHTHKQLTTHPHAHNACTANIIEHVRYSSFYYFLLLPASNAQAYSPLPLQTLGPLSHCGKRTHKQHTKYLPAHDAHTTTHIRIITQSTTDHSLPPPAASAQAYARLSVHTLHLACRFRNPSIIQPLSGPICSRRMYHKQDQPFQSLRAPPPSRTASIKLTCIITSFSSHHAVFLTSASNLVSSVPPKNNACVVDNRMELPSDCPRRKRPSLRPSRPPIT